jgi:hypothetical protein
MLEWKNHPVVWMTGNIEYNSDSNIPYDALTDYITTFWVEEKWHLWDHYIRE